MLYAEIESEEALKVYADHQAHVDFKKLTAPYSTGASFRSVPVSAGTETRACVLIFTPLFTVRTEIMAFDIEV